MNPRLSRLLQQVAARQDLMLVALLVLAIGMMILPLPTLIVDFLLAFNMSATVLLLMVAIYLRQPLDFSTLPAVILIATIFRLALSITTTRLILSNAEAGQIIETFGQFVIAGNLVVGLVIFLIITIVQFVVVTKGSERVAEVSARFTLDAMPGKQMAIDADLRSGEITQAEARERRTQLSKESQFYGAMDGAMKFVKGDAIAGLIITAVNLIGGIAVGSFQKGLGMGEAVAVYSILTIGDGLVAQIPALFTSIACGTIVTRVTTDDKSNLGSDISRQLVAEPRSLQVAAAIMLALAAIPGFPTAIFLFLASLFGGLSLLYFLRDRKAKKAELAEQAEADAANRGAGGEPLPEFVDRPQEELIVQVRTGIDLFNFIDRLVMREVTNTHRTRILEKYGFVFSPPVYDRDASVGRDEYRIFLEHVPVGSGTIDFDKLLIPDGPDLLEAAGVPYQVRRDEDGIERTYVALEERARLEELDIRYRDAHWMLVDRVVAVQEEYASYFVTVDEVKRLLAIVGKTYQDLVAEVSRVVPITRMTDVLKRLVDEKVSIRSMRLILEALLEWGQKEADPAVLTEHVRGALKRQICFGLADQNRIISVFLLDRGLEDMIRRNLRQSAVGSYLALDEQTSRTLTAQVRAQMDQAARQNRRPIFLTAADVRRFFRSFLKGNGLTCPVISQQEMAPEFTVQPVGVLSIGAAAGGGGGNVTPMAGMRPAGMPGAPGMPSGGAGVPGFPPPGAGAAGIAPGAAPAGAAAATGTGGGVGAALQPGQGLPPRPPQGS